ncbi:mitochondrial ribosomal protein [Hypoxylon trugodes]|uniref:mitochondrial ribosomal protein n=1 Tax=Hypoxylon trugodes TaxID=326681 RepID=UPI00219F163C|nr:mitochondrial ribosomal protein [Hypoxylon trugodes]KAI1389841.1 mitochondrial ribosomal protein [Hypoxylon trugodes]
MASGVQAMRLCLRAFRHHPAPRKVGARICVPNRTFSSTPIQWRPAAKKGELDKLEEDGEDDGDFDIVAIEKSLREALDDPTVDLENTTQTQEKILGSISNTIAEVQRTPILNRKKSFWHEEEEDPDLITDEQNEDAFDEDDIMSMAHGKLEEFREYREYARIAAWEMPLLSKLARPFEPPTAQEPLRFRYTSYMGEFHPAESKVVVEFSPGDLPLNDAQQLKMKKLLGPRYNPETDIAKISCEQFEHQVQNKRYLGDLVESLVAQAKDPSDMFEDIPLDTRHHTFKVKPKFPREWRMSEERRKFIDDTRQKSLLLDHAKEEAGALINGKEKIDLFFSAPPPESKVPEFIKARSNRPLPRGKQHQLHKRA